LPTPRLSSPLPPFCGALCLFLSPARVLAPRGNVISLTTKWGLDKRGGLMLEAMPGVAIVVVVCGEKLAM